MSGRRLVTLSYRCVDPMAWGDRYYRKATAAVEKRNGETVVKVGLGSRPGAMAATARGEAWTLTGFGSGSRIPTSKIQRENGKNTRLPTSFLVAVTPTRVHVFKVRNSWGSVRLKRELGVFDRDGLTVDVSGQRVKRFTLHSPADGQTMTFEMMSHRVTDELAEALRRSS
jgi:hypothetical protein